MFRSFPLLSLAVLFYTIIALLGGFNADHTMAALASHVTFKMFSGRLWNFSMGDLVILVSLCLLFVEVLKATRTTAIEVINHALSMMVFVVALVLFIVLQAYATTPFFFIVMMGLFDVVGGFTISIVAAKRDLDVGGSNGLIGTN